VGQDFILPASFEPACSVCLRVWGADRHYLCVPDFYRRRLPHFSVKHRPVFITWRLQESLPPGRYFAADLSSGRAFVAMDSWLDRATAGPLFLKRDEIAVLMAHALEYGERTLGLYALHAWVIMANHVHVLLTPEQDLARVTHSLKRFTAREANVLLGRVGEPFWQDESFDRVVRNDREFGKIVRYIEFNPVTAGLVRVPEEFRWSSAYERGGGRAG
jgi:putative transposase